MVKKKITVRLTRMEKSFSLKFLEKTMRSPVLAQRHAVARRYVLSLGGKVTRACGDKHIKLLYI